MGPKEYTYRLGLYESQIVLPFSANLADLSRPPGIYKERVAIAANSILSTLWVKSIDPGASVSARWYDIGPGNDELTGERIYLSDHQTISTNDTSDRRLITRLHNKAFVEVTVAGGSAVFGIYVTAVSDFPMPGYVDGQPVIVSSDSGLASVIFDPTANKFYLTRGTAGVADVNVVGGTIYVGAPGQRFTLKSTVETDGTWQTIIKEQVPVGKIWRLVSAKFLTPCIGRGDIIIDGISVDEALTSPAENNVMCLREPYDEVTESKWIEIKFKRNFGAVNADITVVATLTEVDA